MEGENRAPRTVAKEPPERLDSALSQSLASYGLLRRFRASGHSLNFRLVCLVRTVGKQRPV